MSDDLISRKALKEFIMQNGYVYANTLDTFPAVDPHKHGRWEDDHDYIKCSVCGVSVKRDFVFFDIGDWNYCPNCGAFMGDDSNGKKISMEA